MATWKDWLAARLAPQRGVEASGAAVLMTTYSMNGNEAVLPTQVADAQSAYGANAVVFAAILARMSLFSEARFAFQNLEDKTLTGSHENDGRRNTSLRLLENPWPGGSTGELLARMIQDADLAGNAYIWNAGPQLVRLRPDWITIVSGEAYDELDGRMYRKVIGYFYDPPPQYVETAGGPSYYTVDEVAHFSPYPDPQAQFRGMSWLTPVIREIQADQAMTEYKIKYLFNSASPNILVKYAQKIGDATVRKVAQRIQDRHGGIENSFGTLVLDEGADVTVIGNTFEQMSFPTVQAAGENRILLASGVPGIVVGAKEGLQAATYSNYEQALRRFADLTMRPLWRSVCASLETLVNVPPGHRLWVDIADIAALRQGEKERADTMLVLSQAVKTFVDAGFTAETVVSAVTSGELSTLKWEKPEPPPAPRLPAMPRVNGTDPATDPPALNGNPPKPALNGSK